MPTIDHQNWRWCSKCKSLHYGGATAGACAAGGNHDASTSMGYVMPTSAPEGVASSQSTWRKCTKCQVLFYNAGNGGSCAAGGVHDATGSPELVLAGSAY